MKLSVLAGVILGLSIAAGSLSAQPYGMDKPQPVGAYLRRTGFSGLIYTVLKFDDLATWSPVADGILPESVQPVSGKNMEIVTDQIVNISPRAFFRIEVKSIAP